MYALNEIPLSGKPEQKEIHWMNVDFDTNKCIGLQSNVLIFVEGGGAGRGLMELPFHYTHSKTCQTVSHGLQQSRGSVLGQTR